MTNLISGKEAKLAWANGERIEYYKGNLDEWFEVRGNTFVSVFDIMDNFRIKPRTITINGIEVPACGADYKPHTFMFVLNSLEPCEYSKIILDDSDEVPPYWWRTEEEIKQVVAALRQVLEVRND
ncbi:hypothetical protein [Acinetobacter indicus]|uniref:hypothetical protein n=1 Tax=Acinetobacter indicus TaxID=756892 RepID=UPI000CECB63F|nr:hypothetical protein [Acinetobacter indicus]